MRLIIIRKNKNSTASSGDGLLRFAISNEPIAAVFFNGLSKNLQLNGDKDVVFAIPEKWCVEPCLISPKINRYGKDITLSYDHLRLMKRETWLAISDGRFATQIDSQLIKKVLTDARADVVSVNVKPELLPYSEKVRLTIQGNVAGFRRLYSDSAESAPFPADWPHRLFIKTDVINQILTDRTLPLAFSKLINIFSSNSLTIRSVSIGGTVLDLDTEEGLLSFLTTRFKFSVHNYHNVNNGSYEKIFGQDNIEISDNARLFGKILFGQNVCIGQDAIIVGPTIIGNGAKIAKGAVIRASIIGPGVSVPRNHIIQNRVFIGRVPKPETTHLGSGRQRRQNTNLSDDSQNSRIFFKNSCSNNFRTHPRFSYVGCLKRITDIVVATTVLILFAPIFPVIALIIKLTSRGPVFFKDTRQGLHGKPFKCLKFRTMLAGADKMQDKLRVLNQVDGPQFRVLDDPRLSAIGKFLRDTYIDEVPQFFNVLLGQMSVAGPRPSPESENTLCPPWRDARLSVRPGITGLWQVCRTRQPMKDFQEWVHYDIKYVRNLSMKMDLWIYWQTAKKMVKNFVKQF
jgi:lipopolysaccharide/colanic/teichoic acid biosynthesis glycosyltransferase